MNKKVFSLVLFLFVILGLCFASCDYNSNNQENTTSTVKVETCKKQTNSEEVVESKTKKTVIVYITQSTTTNKTDGAQVTKKTTKSTKTSEKATKSTATKTTKTKKTTKNETTTKLSGNINTGYTDSNGDFWSPTY